MSLEDQGDPVAQFEGLLNTEIESVEEVPASEESEQAEYEESAEVEEVEAADDTDEVDEAEEADETEEVEAAEVDNTEDDPDGSLVEFTLTDGQVIRTTKEELASSYMRQRDYTQKSQAQAQAKRELDTQKAQFFAEMQRQLQMLQDISEPEIDWAARIAEDPYEGPIEHFQWQEKQKKKQQLAEQTQAHYNQQAEQYVAQQRQLLPQIIPEWNNPDVDRQENPQIGKFLVEEMGFAPDDLKSVQDARLVKLALLAMRQHKLQSQATKVVRKKVNKAKKVLRPGSAPKKQTSRSRLNKKIEAMRTNSGTDAIAATFEEIL